MLGRNLTSSGLLRTGAPTNIIDAISEADNRTLQRIAAEVNTKFFRNLVTTQVCWGIPSATEPGEPTTDIAHLDEIQMAQLAKAVQHFNHNRFDEAKRALEPFVQIGQRECSQLYLKCLIRLDDPNFKAIAAKINKIYSGSLSVAAGSTEQREDEPVMIRIHPALSASAGNSAPHYVIGYVTFHEYLHKWWDTTPENPHPQIFRRMDKTFPDRKKAIRWLQDNNFTTIEDSIL